MKAARARDYLVVVRAGTHSLHPRLLEEDPLRNWDCCVNVWGDAALAEPVGVRPEFCLEGGLNKFDGYLALHAQLTAHAPYRYVLMLDDDLVFAPGSVSTFFEHCEREALALAQPAIALGSHANHVLNICNAGSTVRRVNFVEVMAPCFSRLALERLMPTFTLTRCTWGIDYAWSSLLADEGGLAIVDAVDMQHTKPMDVNGGPFYRRLNAMGIDPKRELQSVHQRFAPWGPMRTLETGHRYRRQLPEPLALNLLRTLEENKLAAHLARGGTLAPQTPAPGRVDKAPQRERAGHATWNGACP